MTHNIEDIKAFIRSQIDASIQLSGGPLSQRSFDIIVQRTIKHFNISPDTLIEFICAGYTVIPPNIYKGTYDVRIAFGADAPPEAKPKARKPAPQAAIESASSSSEPPIDGGVGGS